MTLSGSYILTLRWIGPFRVVQRIDQVAYKLTLIQTLAGLHPGLFSMSPDSSLKSREVKVARTLALDQVQ